MSTKQELFSKGVEMVEQFCELNDLPIPTIIEHEKKTWPFGTCAYYRPTEINICVKKCAAIGVAGPAWSYPGNTVDRTPYGVMAHELGHHVDYILSEKKGKYGGNFSIDLRKRTGEEKLTNYCPNSWEWFAEIFRLFITNPHLLSILRPKTFEELYRKFQPVEERFWQEVLADAPERTIKSVRNKVLKVDAIER